MAKRKSKREAEKRDAEELPDAPPNGTKRKNDDSDSDEDMDVIDVDFEWFDPNPEIDFHGLKTLLRQLFDIDALKFDISALADLILTHPFGSTVKTEGEETDPYAFLTVLDLATHKDVKVIKDLVAYFGRHASSNTKLELLPRLLGGLDAQVGLILTERFVNMPHEVVPPMYTMLQDEISRAAEENDPYTFTHFLIVSKTYSEVQSTLPTGDEPPSKKSKKASRGEGETFYFHPEDEVLHQHAIGWTNFDYETPADEGASDSKRAFQELGVKPKGHLILIEAGKFKGAVEAVQGYLNGGQ